MNAVHCTQCWAWRWRWEDGRASAQDAAIPFRQIERNAHAIVCETGDAGGEAAVKPWVSQPGSGAV
jgi:hypothetical protein